MREVVFLKNNEKKWRKIERLMQNKSAVSADELAEIFVELTDDLAFAQTNYPDSKVTLYLNDMTADLYRYIYKNKKEKGRRLITYWTHELPLEFYKVRKIALIAFGIFVAGMVIGAVSTYYNDEFPWYMFSNDYMNMTIDNIDRGDPIAVYSKMDEAPMFFYIAGNNLMVSAIMFVAGMFFGIGSVYATFREGISLGTLQYFFIAKGVFWSSFLGIWIHGVLEMSMMLIASTAGMAMGSSWLFPGTHTRTAALKAGVKRGVKLFLGALPIIVIAAFLESYVTNPRDYELHWAARGVIVMVTGGFILWYFLIYPVRLQKKMGLVATDHEGNIVYGAVIFIIGAVLASVMFFGLNELGVESQNIDTAIWLLIIPMIVYGGYRIFLGVRGNRKKTHQEITYSN